MEFRLDFGVFCLNTFETVDPSSDRDGQAGNVSGWLSNETSKLSLSKGEQSGVLQVSLVVFESTPPTYLGEQRGRVHTPNILTLIFILALSNILNLRSTKVSRSVGKNGSVERSVLRSRSNVE